MNDDGEKEIQRRIDSLINLYKENKFNEAINFAKSFIDDHPKMSVGYNIFALSNKAL